VTVDIDCVTVIQTAMMYQCGRSTPTVNRVTWSYEAPNRPASRYSTHSVTTTVACG